MLLLDHNNNRETRDFNVFRLVGSNLLSGSVRPIRYVERCHKSVYLYFTMIATRRLPFETQVIRLGDHYGVGFLFLR